MNQRVQYSIFSGRQIQTKTLYTHYLCVIPKKNNVAFKLVLLLFPIWIVFFVDFRVIL